MYTKSSEALCRDWTDEIWEAGKISSELGTIFR